MSAVGAVDVIDWCARVTGHRGRSLQCTIALSEVSSVLVE